MVLTSRRFDNYNRPVCARSPASLCAFAERSSDRKQLIFTAFDPLKGRGRELRRFDTDAGDPNYIWDLSPDGTCLAILRGSEGRIHILPLDGRASQEITVKGWSSLQSVDWAADGKGLFASSPTRDGSALLRVDLRGRAHVLWDQKGSALPSVPGGLSVPWAVPSPDGRHLAIYSSSLNANMWMMENF